LTGNIYSTGRRFEPVHSSGRFCTREEEESLNLHMQVEVLLQSRRFEHIYM
jgi:hypothetical protein